MEATVSDALLRVLSDGSPYSKPHLPTSSSALLRHLILHNAPLKLTDRDAFVQALWVLAENWEHGCINVQEYTEGTSYARDITVRSVTLNGEKKRKRDCDDDQMTGSSSNLPMSSTG
jgi:hypothetical protein